MADCKFQPEPNSCVVRSDRVEIFFKRIDVGSDDHDPIYLKV
jgi:hypothetical protein